MLRRAWLLSDFSQPRFDAVRSAIKIALVTLLLVVAAGSPGAGGAELGGARDDVDEHALFKAVGAMYDLDPELLEAVAQVESGGRADAVSSKGAVGLMQLMPATAAHYRVRDSRDPIENALGAARYLSHLRDAILPEAVRGDSLSRILAAYNAGEGAVWRYEGIPPYAETQEYVGRVLWVYLLGVSPPALAPAGRMKTRTVHGSGHHRSSDSEVLEQLDSLRRERSAATAASEARAE
jgi:soluble lytic murein transglycosylase-like protein